MVAGRGQVPARRPQSTNHEKLAALRDQAGLAAAIPAIRGATGPVFYDIKVRAEELPLVLPPKDGVHLKDRFRAALLGPEAAG